MISNRKQWPVLMTILLGLSIVLNGCGNLTAGLSKQSTPTAAMPTTLDSTDKTIPSVPVTPEDTTSQTPTSSQKLSESVKTTPLTSTEKSNPLTISKAKYNQLKYGDTYEKIKSLLGGTGDIVTESGTKGSKGYAVTYLCHVKSPSGAEVFLAFKDNKLVNKMEVNLQ
ncbi:hypothetical protein [Desulfosporosinus sp. SB140]|uniref:hypothetical protein n=1 Tax=Desulfosporosinus paludis TaxID=3115649 RepID=UPI00388E7BF0